MTSLWFYDRMSRVRWLNYRAKIMMMAFLGTHVPLIVLASHYGLRTATSWIEAAWALGVTLSATLVGTVLTLAVLHELLRPVVATSAALRAYRTGRVRPKLPTCYSDEVGTLMADAQDTMTELDASLLRLERFDVATGVLNRAAFVATVGEGPVAVVRLVNHDHVVQSLDAGAATEVLRRIIARLTARIGVDATLGRIADADLAVRLTVQMADDDGLLLRDLLRELARPVEVGDVRLTPVLAAGLAPVGDGGLAAALDDAVAALATTSEAAPVAAHSARARGKLRDRFLIEQELRAALRNDEFVLHFQPIVDVEQGRPVGAEALIRWQSPSRGLVPPGVFIPVAESSGLIEPIGCWVLREACRQVAGWDPGLRVSINLGAAQFLDEDLAWHVMEATSAASISPYRLEIELTESVAMVDHDHTRRAFGRLRDMGVQIAIDDFGTGYASMSTLRKLPFDKLKIDREFVSDVHRVPGSQAICDAMIALGRGLDLRVLAEGCEQAEEVAHLAARGCLLFQGYHFSRPVPAEALGAAFARLDGTAPARQAS